MFTTKLPSHYVDGLVTSIRTYICTLVLHNIVNNVCGSRAVFCLLLYGCLTEGEQWPCSIGECFDFAELATCVRAATCRVAASRATSAASRATSAVSIQPRGQRQQTTQQATVHAPVLVGS